MKSRLFSLARPLLMPLAVAFFRRLPWRTNQRAGLFMLHRGDPEHAETHFLRTVDLYSFWGARAKVEQLRRIYKLNEGDMEWKDSSKWFLGCKKFSAEEANKHRILCHNRRKSLPRMFVLPPGNVTSTRLLVTNPG